MGVLEFVVALMVGVFCVVAMVLGVWKVVHIFRRQHRLERERDEREHKKQLAADYAEALKMLSSTDGTMSFTDYTSPVERVLLEGRNEKASGDQSARSRRD
jgi:hypothetical protein